MKEQVIALSGGVGGAKLVLGLSSVLEKDELLVVANTGDDFEHLGFPVCPDIDTLLYTLGGICNTETGWGRAEETWSFMNTLKKEDPEQAWFQLGDKDIETHNYRKKALAAGNTLTEVTADLVRQFRITPTVVPMSDFPVRTWVLTGTETGNNWMPFQEYFVKHQCKPRIYGIEYRGSQQASVPLQLDMALTSDSIRAVIICPSNPFLSIDPIMAVPGMVDLLRSCGAPVVAVSPIVGGQALKGPTAKIMKELGIEVDVQAIADHYHGIIDGLVIDNKDRGQFECVQATGVQVAVTNTVMLSLEDRKQLAQDVLSFTKKI
ncbi:MAG: 2-phospho-L-lactate transferase [Deltaproteobacteria bacterium]|jgi:LPPG:FO 2-phospho-L-lactate transferase|nr:2-phospho-L-lactate transferase [Deltaproteobacteria bacterium]